MPTTGGSEAGSLLRSPNPHSWIKGEEGEGEERDGRKGGGPPMSEVR